MGAMAAAPPSELTNGQRRFHVDADDAGERLDRWLTRQEASLSRSRIQQLITQGHVLVEGQSVPASTALKAGQMVSLQIPLAVSTTLVAQAMDLDIIFEDAHLVVVNKPAGLVVHPAAGNPDKTLVNALLAHCGDSLRGIGGELRPGIVHRLDKDTSGLLVAAKSGEVHANLSEQFAEHTIERSYDALIWGVPLPRTGVISGQIGRSTSDRQKMAVRQAGGKYAETHYKTKEAFGKVAALVACVLETGRTHQIRVHLSSLGHSVIGDPVYGSNRSKPMKELTDDAAEAVNNFKRQALHARVLGFTHPITSKELRFECAPPDDFQALTEALRIATKIKPRSKKT